MYKKMLVPLDGSEFAERSLEHAKIVAIACRCPEVTLLRVIEPNPQLVDIGGVATEEWFRNAQKRAEAEVKKYITRVADRLKKEGLKVKGVVVKGKAADEILDYAKKNQIDIIVMSTHGRSGLSQWIVGSVADKIIRHSPAPVLIASPAECRV